MVCRKSSQQNSLHSFSIISTFFKEHGEIACRNLRILLPQLFMQGTDISFFISQFYMTNKMGETSAPYYRIYISSIVLIQRPDPPRRWFSLSSSVKVSPATTNSSFLRLFPNQQKMRCMPVRAIYFSSSSFVAHCNQDIFYLTPSTMLLC